MLVARSSPPAKRSARSGGGVHLIGGHSSAQHRRANIGIARPASADECLHGLDTHRQALLLRPRDRIEIRHAAAIRRGSCRLSSHGGRNRNFKRARSRCSRNTSESRNSSRDALQSWENLIPTGQTHSAERRGTARMRVRPRLAAKNRFPGSLVIYARCCGQANVVDLRIRAPDAASRDRDLEFARKVIKVVVAGQQSRRFKRQRRSIANFIGIDSGDGATCHVSCDITAGARCEFNPTFAQRLRAGSGNASMVTQCN